ncbi:carbohydrate ABC transporter permease [Phytoactinopolyspora endophytica]|uniref:carbohydrate ABC transporter permease n=1 Tax=Phytoactinopolyspora endophytica TaxID=1642495 RepID=UPI00197C1999|nr:sugar ABC transporter permease [Phytoactinopolyspora endophytica]
MPTIKQRRREPAERAEAPSTPTDSKPAQRRSTLRRALTPWAFLAPALVLFAYFKFYPIGYGIWLSFFDVAVFGENTWIGLDNFTAVFQDTFLQQAFWNTAVYVVLAVGFSALIGFMLALALEGQAYHIRIVRTAVFLPAVVTVAVVAEVFRILYHPTASGPLNSLLGLIGVGPLGFIDDPGMSLHSVIGMHIWKSAPYDMVIFIAGLAGVDRTLYESARVDGASWLQRVRYVTIPQIRFAFTIVITLGIIRGVRVFPEVYTLTGGGPARSSEVIMTYVYRVSFVDFDLGYAAALSTLLFLLTAVLTAAFLFLRREKA